MTLTVQNLLAFTPELWLLAGALVVFGLTLVRRGGAGGWPSGIALIAIAGSALGLLTQVRARLNILNGSFVLDGYAVVLDLTLLVSAAIVLLLTLPADERRSPAADRTPAFVLLAVMAGVMLVSAADLLAFFAASELLVVAASVAIATHGGRQGTVVSALVAGLAGSAAAGYGLAIAYGLSGETSFAGVGRVLAGRGATDLATLVVIVLVVGGVSFRVLASALRWLADTDAVEVRALAATLLTVAGLGALGRVAALAFAHVGLFRAVVAGLAAVVMTGGTIGTLGERRLGRALGSAVAGQVGFVLAALVALRQPTGVSSAAVLLVGTAPALLAAAIPAGWFAETTGATALPEFAGMIRRAPLPGLVLVLGAGSLAGMPPLIGFFGRFLALAGAVDSGFTWLAMLGVVNLLLMGAWMVRVVREVALEPAATEAREPDPHWQTRIAFAAVSAGVGLLAILLSPITNAAASVAQGLPR